CTNSRSEQGAIENTGNAGAGTLVVKGNLLVSRGRTCPQGYDNDADDRAVQLSANQYAGYAPAVNDKSPMKSEPHFVDEHARDLRQAPGASSTLAGASLF